MQTPFSTRFISRVLIISYFSTRSISRVLIISYLSIRFISQVIGTIEPPDLKAAQREAAEFFTLTVLEGRKAKRSACFVPPSAGRVLICA